MYGDYRLIFLKTEHPKSTWIVMDTCSGILFNHKNERNSDTRDNGGEHSNVMHKRLWTQRVMCDFVYIKDPE